MQKLEEMKRALEVSDAVREARLGPAIGGKTVITIEVGSDVWPNGMIGTFVAAVANLLPQIHAEAIELAQENVNSLRPAAFEEAKKIVHELESIWGVHQARVAARPPIAGRDESGVREMRRPGPEERG
jgi:hypothetical protein